MRFLVVVGALAVPLPCAAERCQSQRHEGHGYIVCTVDARKETLRLFDADEAGTAYGTFDAVSAALGKRGQKLAFAMNAGMYDALGKPVGLYVEESRPLKPASTRESQTNFGMKPNGIFWVDGDRLGVQETSAYLAAAPLPRLATQSGPMLLVDGAVHPKIMPSGTSRKSRNAVGAKDEHTAVFVISEEPVTFFELATFFRDALGCKNALFLDGTVSSLYAPELKRDDALFPLGPVIGVVTGAASK